MQISQNTSHMGNYPVIQRRYIIPFHLKYKAIDCYAHHNKNHRKTLILKLKKIESTPLSNNEYQNGFPQGKSTQNNIGSVLS
jgi:hypothetical protein